MSPAAPPLKMPPIPKKDTASDDVAGYLPDGDADDEEEIAAEPLRCGRSGPAIHRDRLECA